MYLFVAEESPFGSEEILQKDVWKKKDVCVFNTHIYMYYRYTYTIYPYIQICMYIHPVDRHMYIHCMSTFHRVPNGS